MPVLSLVEARAVITTLWLYKDVSNRKEAIELVKLKEQEEEVRILEVQLSAAKAQVSRTEHSVSYWHDESERVQGQIERIQEGVCRESGCPAGSMGGPNFVGHGILCSPRSGPPVWGRTALPPQLFEQPGSASGPPLSALLQREVEWPPSVPTSPEGEGAGAAPGIPVQTGFPPP